MSLDLITKGRCSGSLSIITNGIINISIITSFIRSVFRTLYSTIETRILILEK
jgi:hypothetical protein